jgi:hypothetical protein
MSQLEKEDLVSIVKFYKDKASELEFQYLVLQLESKKETKIAIDASVKAAIVEKSKKHDESLFEIDNLKKTVTSLNLKHSLLSAKYEKLNNQYLKLKETKNTKK